MIQIINPKEPQLQLSGILRIHIGDYQKTYPLSELVTTVTFTKNDDN